MWEIAWFIQIGVFFAGYSVLDGFDLGIGLLWPLLSREGEERDLLFSTVEPFWDGNEVWLITGGAALFAAFPHAYATVFSGFYLVLMVLLFALIFRAVSLEFRRYDARRRSFWEKTFWLGSFLPALLFGVALGNVVQGVPLDEGMNYVGSLLTLLRPYPLTVGLLGLLLFLIQGATYAQLKCPGELGRRGQRLALALVRLFPLFLLPPLLLSLTAFPWAKEKVLPWLFTLLSGGTWLLLLKALKRRKEGISFLLSSLLFLEMWGTVGSLHFPYLVRSTGDSSLSLTVWNAASQEQTLRIMFLIALLGMPLVIVYTLWAYRVFLGKFQGAKKNH